MENYLLEGFRLHQPLNCPDQLYTVMVSRVVGREGGGRGSVSEFFNFYLSFNEFLLNQSIFY